MHDPLNPPNRPRKGVVAALAAVVLVATVTVLVVVGGGSSPVEAAGLERFGSCAELSDWGVRSYEAAGATYEKAFDTVGSQLPTTAAPAPAPTAGESAGTTAADSILGGDRQASATGDTNVIVSGVDELDLVDRLAGNRVLIVADAKLAVVDLDGAKVLDQVAVGYDSQITYDAGRHLVWVVGSGDQGGVRVRRFALDGDALSAQGSWSTSGYLVAARRIDDRLYVVASDGFGVVSPPGIAVPDVAGPAALTSDATNSDAPSSDATLPDGGANVASRPFADGPVPCDRVLHPVGASDPNATLLVAFEASGDLAPVASTEVVGSGQLVHVTTDAAYLATPQWGQEITTTIHRFDLSSLDHTGSGTVEGSLLNEFSMSEADGHLRVAVTDQPPMVGGPMAVDDVVPGDMVVPPQGTASGSTGSSGGGVASDPAPETTIAETSVPDTTIPETTIPETVPGTTEPELTAPPQTVPMPTVPLTVPPTEPPTGEALNRIVVLDTQGALDVVGRTAPFGHPGETLQGVRFDGDTAYAVTYRNTDPFYVVDLSDPAAPRVVGQVELPGFSAYLHPVGDGLVVGFGPDGEGRSAAKLFDVSDPAAPTVVDTVVLGDDSPVATDHHAFVDLGNGRFAVPVNTWPAYVPGPCPPGAECLGVDGPVGQQTTKVAVVELSTAGRRLRETGRVTAAAAQPASRAIRHGDAWAVLAGSQLVVLDTSGNVTATLAL